VQILITRLGRLVGIITKRHILQVSNPDFVWLLLLVTSRNLLSALTAEPPAPNLFPHDIFTENLCPTHMRSLKKTVSAAAAAFAAPSIDSQHS
jgi:hypothetical protein